MDRLTYNDFGQRDLSAIPAAAHQQKVAMEVLRAAWRRRRLIIAGVLLVGAMASAILLTKPPAFKAEAIVELQVGRPDPIAGETSAGVSVEAASIVLGEARIIRSRLIGMRVVERLKLADDPAFTGRGPLGRLTDWAKSRLGLPSDPADLAARAETTLARSLSVDTDNRSYLIAISYTSHDAAVSARIANAVAEEYLARRLESTLDAAGLSTRWLEVQVSNADAQMRTAEAAVSAFRERTGLVHLGSGVGVPSETLRQQELRAIATQLQAAVAERTAEEARLARLETRLREGGPAAAAAELQAAPAVQAASQQTSIARRALAEAQSRLGPRHPTVVQAVAAVTAAEAAMADAVADGIADRRANLVAARTAEQDLRERQNALERRLLTQAAEETELAGLTAIANGARDRYLALTRSRDQARGLRDLRTVPASLIVPALPPRLPSGPNPAALILLAMMGTLLAGVAAAALAEQLDRGFRTSDEVTSATGLRCVSLVPERVAGEPPLTRPGWPATTADQVMFDEAVRLVASSVGLFSAGRGEGGQVVLVTSSLADEGRSTLCAGLARSLTLAGRRVLLIDGPPRRFDEAAPQASAVAEAEAEASPLSAEGDAQLVVLRRNSLSAATLDVFGSPRLSSALEHARKHFDVIIVEGPPILLMADSLVLGRMSDTVLHVVRWAETRRKTVHAALRRMQEHGVIVDGIVLSRVAVERHGEMALGDSASHHLSAQDYYARNLPPAAPSPLAIGR